MMMPKVRAQWIKSMRALIEKRATFTARQMLDAVNQIETLESEANHWKDLYDQAAKILLDAKNVEVTRFIVKEVK